MFQLLLTLLLVLGVFWLFWGPLGGRELYLSLTRDEVAELERQLEELDEELALLPADPSADDEAGRFLRQHCQGRRRRLELKLDKARRRAR